MENEIIGKNITGRRTGKSQVRARTRITQNRNISEAERDDNDEYEDEVQSDVKEKTLTPAWHSKNKGVKVKQKWSKSGGKFRENTENVE